MERLAGYSRIVARVKCHQLTNKRLFRKPYLKYGQCYVAAVYFFQLGAVLGARHRHKLAAFGHAFLGLVGKTPTAMESFVFREAEETVMPRINEGMTFKSYVDASEAARFKYPGDPKLLFVQFGMTKVSVEVASAMFLEFAEQGVVLGASDPEVTRDLFERTHAAKSSEGWAKVRAAGLDVPEHQDVMTYSAVESAENEAFMAYCEECCPEHFKTLRS
jgi:hypothetical protein